MQCNAQVISRSSTSWFCERAERRKTARCKNDRMQALYDYLYCTYDYAGALRTLYEQYKTVETDKGLVRRFQTTLVHGFSLSLPPPDSQCPDSSIHRAHAAHRLSQCCCSVNKGLCMSGTASTRRTERLLSSLLFGSSKNRRKERTERCSTSSRA